MRLFSLAATLGIATLSIASMVACGGAPSSNNPGDPATDDGAAEEIKSAVIDEGDNNKTIPVALGKAFTIALSDNASTGYVWSVKSVDKTLGQPKISQIPGDSSRPGASGLKKFTWSTKSPLDLVGTHKIVLEHARPFGSSPSTLFTVTIDIKDNAQSASCGGLVGGQCGRDAYCDFSINAHCGAGDQTGKMRCEAPVLPRCRDAGLRLRR